MNKIQILNEFEIIVVLKTIIFDIDENYIALPDIEKINYYAEDMGVDNFPYHKFELTANPSKEELIMILHEYVDYIYDEYCKIKNGLLK